MAQGSFERVPPQNIEAERAVLGAMMLNPTALGTAVEILHENPEDVFYVEAHQHLYRAILGLFRESVPIDAITLIEALQKDAKLEAAGGAPYIAELAGVVPTSANIEYYARIVQDAAILRGIISTCTTLCGEAYLAQGDVTELLDRAESNIFAIAERRQLNPVTKVSDLLEESIKKIESIIESKSGITGLPTGFRALDDLLSGLQPSDMIILAARPSVGKTAFSLSLAANAAIKSDKSVLIFSLEMAKEQLVQRLLCMQGGIDSRRLRTGFLASREFPKLQQAASNLSRAKIYIDDAAGLSPLDLRAKARRVSATYGLDFIIVDYLQLMSTGVRVENRQQEIATISRSIKGIARELNVPVLALSQLSREAEKDDTGIPKLSHLRESGAIEQDADVVLMLARPRLEEAEGNENLINVAVAKQRNGPTGNIQLLFDRNTQNWRNFDSHGPGVAPPPEAAPEYDDTDYAAEEIYGDDEDDKTPF